LWADEFQIPVLRQALFVSCHGSTMERGHQRWTKTKLQFTILYAATLKNGALRLDLLLPGLPRRPPERTGRHI